MICFAIEYARTYPKLLGWCFPDPKVDSEGDAVTGSAEDDEDVDVAFEARRVERMAADRGGVFGSGEDGVREEVVLKGLRKVYRTKQARANRCRGWFCCSDVHYLYHVCVISRNALIFV